MLVKCCFFVYNNNGDDMLNKKGFTLVELLAVIVVLTVLILMAVPKVVKVINNSKKSTFIDEGLTMLSAAKSKYASYPFEEDITYNYEDLSNLMKIKDDYSGRVEITIVGGETILKGWLSNSNYYLENFDEDVKISDVKKH